MQNIIIQDIIIHYNYVSEFRNINVMCSTDTARCSWWLFDKLCLLAVHYYRYLYRTRKQNNKPIVVWRQWFAPLCCVQGAPVVCRRKRLAAGIVDLTVLTTEKTADLDTERTVLYSVFRNDGDGVVAFVL